MYVTIDSECCCHISNFNATHTLVTSPKIRLRHLKRRASFYVFMSIAESPDAQKRGLVAVYYCLDHFNIISVNDSLRKSVPLHLASIHVCYNDEIEFTPVWVAIRALHTEHRVRYHSHFGTYADERCSAFGMSLLNCFSSQ
jgi:hypothetical protein